MNAKTLLAILAIVIAALVIGPRLQKDTTPSHAAATTNTTVTAAPSTTAPISAPSAPGAAVPGKAAAVPANDVLDYDTLMRTISEHPDEIKSLRSRKMPPAQCSK